MQRTLERPGAVAAGLTVLAVIGASVLAAVVALLHAAIGGSVGAGAAFDSYIWRVVRFTLLQATLSTLLSVGLAIPLARALARHPAFPARTWLLRLFAVPLGLPAIVAALGLIEIWGRQGMLNALLISFGLSEPVSIYGLAGILLAHVFFNLPLATRLLLAAIEGAPAEYWRNAAQLGLPARRIFALVEWSAMRRVLPGVAGLVFMLCATSFTLVLLLGGGPAATTIEVAIYQALRFDFDPPRAVLLALLQIGLTGLILAVLARLPGAEEGMTAGGAVRRFDAVGRLGRTLDFGAILIGGLFIAAPMLAVLVAGLGADLARLLGEATVHRAFMTSLAIAAAAALLSVSAALAVTYARHALAPVSGHSILARSLRTLLAGASSMILLVPPIVLGAGWFVLLRGRVDLFAMAPAIVIVINAFMALPFAMRVVEPAHAAHAARTDRLARSLGIGGWAKLRIVDLPALRPALATALAFAMALSLGDLGAIALFGSQDVITLPYLLYQRMGSYRTEDAAGLALLLAVLCMLFMIAGTRARPAAGAWVAR